MRVAILLGALALVDVPAAHAQEDASEEAAPAPGKKKKKKTKKASKKKGKHKAKAGKHAAPDAGEPEGEAETPAADTEEGPAEPGKDRGKGKAKEASEAAQPSSLWFTDWPTRAFSLSLGPILDFKATQETGNGETIRATTMEGGLQVGVDNIPIVPGNVGVDVSPRIGWATGFTAAAVTGADDVKSTTFVRHRRAFGGIETTLYLKFYRHILDLGGGSLSDTAGNVVHSLRIRNDFGLNVLPFLSAHLTHTYLKGYVDSGDDPFLVQNDYWLHANAHVGILGLGLDFGPGFTVVEEYPTEDLKITGRTDYLLATTALPIFWKLGMTGRAKYVYASSNDDLGATSSLRLPEEPLNRPKSRALPEDSFYASLFFGLRNLFFGAGVGYTTSIEVLNASDHTGKRRVTRDSGFGLHYEVNF